MKIIHQESRKITIHPNMSLSLSLSPSLPPSLPLSLNLRVKCPSVKLGIRAAQRPEQPSHWPGWPGRNYQINALEILVYGWARAKTLHPSVCLSVCLSICVQFISPALGSPSRPRLEKGLYLCVEETQWLPGGSSVADWGVDPQICSF